MVEDESEMLDERRVHQHLWATTMEGDRMQSTSSRSGLRAWVFAAVAVSTVAWLGVLGNTALAQPSTAAGVRVAAAAQQMPQGTAQAASQITKDEAAQIALKAVPGKVLSVVIEKKFGKQVYVVEVMAQADSVETDVFVDPQTGEVVGTEQ
jgi:hypothetical protein